MKTGFRTQAAFAIAALAGVPATLQAADAALVYNKTYQCGKEIIQVSRCRRDSDTPDMPPTVDADNFCQVYYLDRPKNGIGGTAFGIELRSELEQRLRGCGALGGAQAAARPAVVPAAQAPGTSGGADASTAEYEKGVAFTKQKNYVQAIEAFRRSIAIRPSAKAWNDLGIAYSELKQYQQAVESYRQASIIQPDSHLPHYSRGVSHLQLKQYDAAIAAFSEALRLKPDYHDAANQLGMAYYYSGKYDHAIAAYREAVRLQPGDASYHANLGYAYYAAKRYAETVAAQEQALRLNPALAGAANSLGMALDAQNNYRAAAEAFQQAIRLKPDKADYRGNLGLTYVKWGGFNRARFGDALVAYKEAIRLAPAEPAYYSALALTYAAMGKSDDARRVSASLRKIDAKEADELARKLLDWEIVNAVNGASKP